MKITLDKNGNGYISYSDDQVDWEKHNAEAIDRNAAEYKLMMSIKLNKKRGYLMANKENSVVEITSVNNGYVLRVSDSSDTWVYEDIDDLMKQVREMLETAYEEDKE